MKTKIIFIRHGESQGNAIRKILGHTDMDLSELGYRQAYATAEALKDERVDAVYSSDLLRAFNTAKPNADMRGLEVVPSRQLREVYVGKWENRFAEDIIAEYGEDEYFGRWLGDFGNFVFPDGEAVWDAGNRFYREVLRIAEMHLGQTIIIAAHAAVIRACWGIFTGLTPDNISEALPFPTNASYSVASYENGRLVPVEFSCDAHLSAVGITHYKG